RSVGVGAQPQRTGRPLAAQIQVAITQARLLADLSVLVQLERQRRRGAEHLDLRGRDLDLARVQQRVLVALGPLVDGTDHFQHVCVAQVHRLYLAHHDLRDTAGITSFEERHTAIGTRAAYPAREGHGLADVLGAELAGEMGAQHEDSFTWGRMGGTGRAMRQRPSLPRRVSDLATVALSEAGPRP